MKKTFKFLLLITAISLFSLSSCSDSSNSDDDWEALYSSMIAESEAAIAEATTADTTIAETTTTTSATTVATTIETTTTTTIIEEAPQKAISELCATDLIDNTLANIEETYGLELYLEQVDMTVDFGYSSTDMDFAFMLSCGHDESRDKAQNIIKAVHINKGGYLTEDIRCGMTYEEMISAAPDIEMTPYMNEFDGSIGVDIFICDNYYANVVWNNIATLDEITSKPCSSIILSHKFKTSEGFPVFGVENDIMGAVGMIDKTIPEIEASYKVDLENRSTQTYYGSMTRYEDVNDTGEFPYTLKTYEDYYTPDTAPISNIDIKEGGFLNSRIKCGMSYKEMCEIYPEHLSEIVAKGGYSEAEIYIDGYFATAYWYGNDVNEDTPSSEIIVEKDYNYGLY